MGDECENPNLEQLCSDIRQDVKALHKEFVADENNLKIRIARLEDRTRLVDANAAQIHTLATTVATLAASVESMREESGRDRALLREEMREERKLIREEINRERTARETVYGRFWPILTGIIVIVVGGAIIAALRFPPK